MRNNRYTSYLFIVFLTSCSSSDNSQQNLNSPLLGSWETQACQENINSSFNPPLATFSKATYEFLQNGDIMYSPNSYTDSTCTTIAFNTLSPNHPVASFLDLGETTLEEGIPGNKLNIQIQTLDTILSTNGFFTINNNVLCFSYSYIFWPSSFGISVNERAPIDFSNCLAPTIFP